MGGDKLESSACGTSSCRWTRLDLYCTAICAVTFAVTLIVVFSITSPPGRCDYVTIRGRDAWGAREAKSSAEMAAPVDTVFIHHTSRHQCFTDATCKEAMKNIQEFHMEDKDWDDVAYNFMVGENGWVYEGRGWNTVGAHTLGWNSKSISIAIMGDFNSTLPNDETLTAVQNMISCGVASGHISSAYNLYGHRDATSNVLADPGDALYRTISKWDHFDKTAARPVQP